MSKVINLQDYRNKERRLLEEKAYEQYKVIKIDDDLYLVPDVNFTTGSLELKIFYESELNMEIEDMLESDVIDTINSIVDLPNQTLYIILEEVGEEDIDIYKITNISNQEEFLLSTLTIDSHEKRQIFTGIIASVIKTINIQVTFMLKIGYKELLEIIN